MPKNFGKFLAAIMAFVAIDAIALDKKVIDEALTAASRGASFLVKTQNDDGSWGTHKHPAIAALCIWAVNATPNIDKKSQIACIDKGLKYVLEYVQNDGSIFPKKQHEAYKKQSAYYPNYSTSIILLCLAAIDRPEYRPVMIKARKYLQDSQFKDSNKVDYGGIGYGKTGRADLSNGSWASEALYYTEWLDKEPYTKDSNAQKRNKEMWAAFSTFLTKVQNMPELNKESYVNKQPEEYGGFFYRPNESKAKKNGKEGMIASGSMTYAGLKSMLHAKLKKNDPRVIAAMKYLMKNYVLTENPGMGMQGYFYYLHVMTKALNAFGADTLKDSDGVSVHDWRKDVTKQFVKLQKKDGSWTNDKGRFMESDPSLATSYAVIALKMLAGKADLNYK